MRLDSECPLLAGQRRSLIDPLQSSRLLEADVRANLRAVDTNHRRHTCCGPLGAAGY